MSQQTQMVDIRKKRRAIFWRALYDEIFPKTVPRPPSKSTNIKPEFREIKLCPSHLVRSECLLYNEIRPFQYRMPPGGILMKYGPDTGFNIYGYRPIMFPRWDRPAASERPPLWQVIWFDNEDEPKPDSDSKARPSFL